MSPDPIHPEPDTLDQDRYEPTRASAGTPASRPRRFVLGRLVLGVAGIALLAVGLGVGAVVASYSQGSQAATFVPVPPAAIADMTEWSTVAIKGQVAEIFGNKFVIEDASGRALVETGPQGESGDLVAKDESVTVQGRFEHGFVHATFIVHADGKAVALAPPHGPPAHGPLGWLHGPRADANSPDVISTPAS